MSVGARRPELFYSLARPRGLRSVAPMSEYTHTHKIQGGAMSVYRWAGPEDHFNTVSSSSCGTVWEPGERLLQPLPTTDSSPARGQPPTPRDTAPPPFAWPEDPCTPCPRRAFEHTLSRAELRRVHWQEHPPGGQIHVHSIEPDSGSTARSRYYRSYRNCRLCTTLTPLGAGNSSRQSP